MSPSQQTITRLTVLHDSVEAMTGPTEYSCAAEDALRIDDVSDTIRKSVKQAAAAMGADYEPGHFAIFFWRISECLWVDWGLSYTVVQILDEGQVLDDAYVEYDLSGNLAQVCGFTEGCINPFGQVD